MNVQETITATEALDEFWKVYFEMLRGLLLVTTRIVCILTRIFYTIALAVLQCTLKIKLFVEQWQPIRPAVFSFGEREMR